MVATWYGDDCPHLSLPKPAVIGDSKQCARVTGKLFTLDKTILSGQDSLVPGVGGDEGNLVLGSRDRGLSRCPWEGWVASERTLALRDRVAGHCTFPVNLSEFSCFVQLQQTPNAIVAKMIMEIVFF